MVLLRMEAADALVPVLPVIGIESPRLPVVEIREIRRGSIVGRIGSGARLIIGGRIILPDGAGDFAVDAAPFLVNIVDIPVPPRARYVGSSKGTKYYPVESKKWLQWKAEPVFFSSEAEAQAAGYEMGK